MKLATRYSLVGLAALAVLTGVGWVRAVAPPLGRAGTYLAGVAPNFSAAITISFVLLGIWTDARPIGPPPASRRFGLCAEISGTGLIAWELLQIGSRGLVFDYHDLGATIAGLAVAALIFRALTPRPARRG